MIGKTVQCSGTIDRERTVCQTLNKPSGVDLSKILVGQSQIFGGNVVKTDICMGVPQFWGVHTREAPQV